MRQCPACSERSISPLRAMWSLHPRCPHCAATVGVAQGILVPVIAAFIVFGVPIRYYLDAAFGISRQTSTLASLPVMAVGLGLLWACAPLAVYQRTSPYPKSRAAHWGLFVAVLTISACVVVVVVRTGGQA